MKESRTALVEEDGGPLGRRVVQAPGSNLSATPLAVGKAARGARSGAWMTPRVVLDRALDIVRAVAPPRVVDTWSPGWALDAAAEPGSACAEAWYGPGSMLRADALTPAPWAAAGPVWLNPPYADVGPFADRALVEAERGLWVGWLSFARMDTAAMQRLWWSPQLAAFAFLPGRVKFVDPTTGRPRRGSAPAPSVFFVLGPSASIGGEQPLRVRW